MHFPFGRGLAFTGGGPKLPNQPVCYQRGDRTGVYPGGMYGLGAPTGVREGGMGRYARGGEEKEGGPSGMSQRGEESLPFSTLLALNGHNAAKSLSSSSSLLSGMSQRGQESSLPFSLVSSVRAV